MLFMVYAGWQDLRLQAGRDLFARVEGQEEGTAGPASTPSRREWL